MTYVTRTHFCAARMVSFTTHAHTHLQPPETISHLPLRRSPLLHLCRRRQPLPASPSPLSPLFSFLLSRLSHLLHPRIPALPEWVARRITDDRHKAALPRPLPQHPALGGKALPRMEGSSGLTSPGLLFHLFHLLIRAITLLMISFSSSVQLFLFPLSVWLTAGVDRPSCLEPER